MKSDIIFNSNQKVQSKTYLFDYKHIKMDILKINASAVISNQHAA